VGLNWSYPIEGLKGLYMKMFAIGLMALVFASQTFAEVNCTKEPVAKWKSQEAFQKEMSAKYTIKKFKVTAGNCYEIYGLDKDGKRVEIYFNPVDGSVVKQRD
jgi:hypothetical protein